MSRRPVLSIDQLTEEEANDLMQTVRRTMRMIKQVHQTESVTIAIQDGRPAGMTVPHIHVHIMPRRENDAVYGDKVYDELERAEFFKSYQNPKISGMSYDQPFSPLVCYLFEWCVVPDCDRHPRSAEEMRAEAEQYGELMKEIRF